jgi:hypothetical protein
LSIAVMDWVWANSPTSGNERLVLLALADACSRDDGTGCWPSAATIARKANISARTVRRVTARLEGDGPEGYPPCQHRVEDGRLILTSAARSDMFLDPVGPSVVPDAGRLLGTPPGGDFTLAARVTVEFASTYDAGVLLLYVSERCWAKLCFELRRSANRRR